MYTVKDFFEIYSKDDETAVIEKHDDGSPALWIEKHDRGMTVVDYNCSSSEKGFADESGEDVEKIRDEWLRCVGKDPDEDE